MGCSVVGLLGSEQTRWDIANSFFAHTLAAATKRGRDSWGIVRITATKTILEHKGVGCLTLNQIPILTEQDRVVICNCRGEPTTEWVITKTPNDIQPMAFARPWVVSHNGTIANDKELIHSLNLITPTKIDTAAFAALLKQVASANLESITAAVSQVVGSYAFLIGHQEHPDKLWLAVNYKPLYILWHEGGRFWLVATLQEFFPAAPPLHPHTVPVPAYSVVELRPDGSCQIKPLGLPPHNKRVLVVCSGGLDSSTTAAWYKVHGYDVTLLHFVYRCRAEQQEVKAIQRLCERIGVDALFVETEIFKRVIRHSPLVGEGDLERTRMGEASAEFAHEWVPARNTIFYAVAIGIAEAHQYHTVALGLNLEESGAYPDNEVELVKRFDEMTPWVVAVGKRVHLSAPLAHLMKHEIVRLGLHAERLLNTRYLDVTWSCYEGLAEPCNKCGPCYMRRHAFRMNNVVDPQARTANLAHDATWDGCIDYDQLWERWDEWAPSHPIDHLNIILP